MAAAVESMVSARVLPWHYNMTKDVTMIADDVMTAAEAIKLGGLDWEVQLQELFVQDGKEYTAAPDRLAVVRNTDHKVLGTVGGRYVPIQNHEAFAFTDNLVEDNSAKYETAGSLKGGKVVFLSMKVPGHIELPGEGNKLDTYIVMTTSHDGTKAVTVFVTIIRPECMNTLTLGLSTASSRWAINHTTSLDGKVHEARETLGMTFSYIDEFQREAEAMIDAEVTNREFKRMLEKVLPDRPKVGEAIDAIITNRDSSPTIADDQRGTAWGAYNAFTEYFDWTRKGAKRGEAQFINVLTGTNARMRNRMGAMLQVAA